MSKKSRKKPTWKWHVDHPLGGPTRVVCGKPLPKTLFIVQFTSISLRLFSDIQSHVCVMHEISHLFLIMFCIWTLMFHLISYVGSYGNACSRFQLMSLLDSRKSGTFLMVCVFFVDVQLWYIVDCLFILLSIFWGIFLAFISSKCFCVSFFIVSKWMNSSRLL